MKNQVVKILVPSLLTAILIPSMAIAGNVKKTYINLSKESNQATAADLGVLATDYSKISTAVSQMTYLKAQGSQFGKAVSIYKTGTINGGSFKTEKTQGAPGLGNAFNSNGIANYLPSTAELDAIKDEYTVEMWVKQGDYTRHPEFEIFGRNSTGNGQPFMILLVGDSWGTDPGRGVGRVGIHASTLNTNGTYTTNHSLGTPQLEKNRWYHVAFSYHKDKGNQLYVDGVPVGGRTGIRGTVAPVNGTNFNTAILLRSSWHNNNVNTSNPTQISPNPNVHIDEIRVWNVDRSAQEIKDNYNKTLTGKEKGLVYYLNFDE